MSIQTIIQTLDNLEKLHKSLLELAYKKTEFIKTGDMDSLDQLLKDEQAHVAAISQLELQRQTVVTDYLRAKGIAPSDTPTVMEVMEAAESPSDQEQLKISRNRLLLTVDQLKFQNDLNQKLTYQSLQFVNLTLDMLKPHPEQINYSRTEAKGDNVNKDKIYFDSQA
ncbi:flagellar protein FlgN [Paenisporosarcina quisquiliarum]|uniref:flagellar protein FlgN n=1 Tax=Paenisporosarcina quisquiliarum TaxID=365346 RepID=UPI003735141F